MSRSLWPPSLLALLSGLSLVPGLSAAEPRVTELRTQRVGEVTYFLVTLQAPDGLRLPEVRVNGVGEGESTRRQLGWLPRLVPDNDHADAVYFLLLLPLESQESGLQFVGKVRTKERAGFWLNYATKDERRLGPASFLAPLLPTPEGAKQSVTLDFSKARAVERPEGPRGRDRVPDNTDLEGLWAFAQARQFAVLEAQTPGFGFYAFAREATGRKYSVPARALAGEVRATRDDEYRRLYETTTGAAALTESLARHRLLRAGPGDRERRTVPVASIRGIDVAEHPWEKMMGERKPAPEPLAAFVPHDQYYVTFKDVRAYLDFMDLAEEWGANVLSAYEIKSRDYQLRERYEKQLCLPSRSLAKLPGVGLLRDAAAYQIKGVAVTGSDLNVREGSDVTVVFHVSDPKLFLLAVQPFLAAARQEFGDGLREGKEKYLDWTVERFVSPLREVSLYRTWDDEHVIYSNSLVALRRVLDTKAGKRKALADALDFRYMRTVFPRGDKGEDGFAFLSDAFIRNLVGPAIKIKERRRLEALTSLSLVTNGALFAAWETGKVPANLNGVLAASKLKPGEVEVPEGEGVVWDGARQVAVSDAYNTLRFATPLVELPIDKVTPEEERDYRFFRDEYLRLWRRFFDPVGLRFSRDEKRVRVETYILPLIQNGEYNRLRDWTGGGTTTFDLATVGPKTLLQYLVHIDTRQWRFQFFGDKRPLGDWAMVRWDDGRLYDKLLELRVRQQLEPDRQEEWAREAARLFFQVPMTCGVKIGNQKDFDELLRDAGRFVRDSLGPVKVEVLKPDYRGVKITRVRFAPDSQLVQGFGLNAVNTPREERFAPVYYHAQVAGAWYLSFSEDALREEIDRSLDRAEGGRPANKDRADVNSSVYIAPEAAFRTAGALHGYLEWETHRRALGSGLEWYALYRAGVLPDPRRQAKESAAFRYFGYVPVSPDDSGYVYEADRDEVVNERHGSVGAPALHADLDEDSPVARLLGQLRTVRADLRFREDGVHTVLTIDRKAKGE
jgi:hypothetical protein